MNKKLNVKLVAWLAGCSVALLVGVHFLHAWQVDDNAEGLSKRADAFLEQAEAARKSGEGNQAVLHYQEALKNYNRYLNYRPGDLDAMITRANIMADLLELRAVTDNQTFSLYMAHIEEAIRRNAEVDDSDGRVRKLRRRLAMASRGIGRWQDAIDHLKVVIKDDPDDLTATFWLADCYQRQQKTGEAISVLYRIIGYDPTSGTFADQAPGADNVDAYKSLGFLLRTVQSNAALADRVMDRMIEVNGKSHRAYLIRGAYRQQFKLEGIGDDLEVAEKLAPEEADVILTKADHLINDKQFDKARAYLERGVKLHPDNGQMYLQQVRLARVQDDRNLAKTWAERGLEKFPRSYQLLMQLAEIQIDLNEWDGLQTTIDALDKLPLKDFVTDYYQALKQLGQRKWMSASHELERIRPAALNDEYRAQIDLHLGTCYEYMQQPDRQWEAFGRVLSVHPTQFSAQAGEVRALLSLGQSAEALRRLRSLRVQHEKPFFGDPRLWRALLDQERTEQLRKPKPETRDWSRVDELLAEVEKRKLLTDEAQFILLRADVLRAKEQQDQARQLLDAARKQFPTDARVALAQLQWIAREEGVDEALKFLDAWSTAYDAQAKMDFRMRKARLIVQKYGTDAKPHLLAIEKDAEDLSAAEREGFSLQLANVYLQIQDYDEARRRLTVLSKRSEENATIHEQSFDVAQQAGDEAWMREVIEAIERADLLGKDSSLWNYAEASRLVWKYRHGETDPSLLDEAAGLVQKALSSRNKWHRLYKLRGEIHQLRENSTDAMEDYQRALNLGPQDLGTISQLVRLLWTHRRFGDALTVLNSLGDTRRSPMQQRLKAEIYLQVENPAAAVEAAGYAVSDDTTNMDDLRWKAGILLSARKFAEAEVLYQRVLQRATDNPQTWYSVVQCQVLQGKRAEAEATIKKARLQLPEHTSLVLLGQCYQLIGNDKFAQRYFRDNLQRYPDEPAAMQALAQFYLQSQRSRMAVPLLNSMISLKTDPPSAGESYRVWARRQMAALLAYRGSYQNVRRGLAQLDKNAKNGVLSPQDRLIRARLLARRPEPSSRSEAIRIFEDLATIANATLSGNDQLALARLYERSGQWNTCREKMLKLLVDKDHDTNTDYIAEYIRMLLRNGEPEQANDWITKIEKTPGKEIMAIELRLTERVKLGAEKEALARLKFWMDKVIYRPEGGKPLNQAPERWPMLLGIANMLTQLEQYPRAEQLYVEYVNFVPANQHVLPVFYGLHGDVDKCFQLLDAGLASKKIQLIKAIDIGLETLRTRHGLAARHTATVKQWLDKAQRDYPESSDVMLKAAMYYDLQGDYATVENIYRKYLRHPQVKDSGTAREAAALNNLAFVLADKLGKPEGGLELVRRAIDILGPQTDLLDTRAMVHLAAGNTDQAIADLKTALEDHSPGNNYMKNFHLAMAYQKAGEKDLATGELRNALKDGLVVEKLSANDRQTYQRLVTELRFDESAAE